MKAYYGKYRGIVRNIDDPHKRGRIRIECPYIYGVGVMSPWALPCLPFGGKADMGDVMLPEVGTGVWVEFENGDLQYPVWTGFWIARPDGESNIPEELIPSDTLRPAVRIIKSEKGHTVLMDDTTGEERLLVIDRAGNTMSFSAAVSDAEKRRGVKTSLENTAYGYADLVDGESHIQIKDVVGQFLELFAKNGEERVKLLSTNSGGTQLLQLLLDNDSSTPIIRLKAENSSSYLDIKLDLSNKKIIFDANGEIAELDGVKKLLRVPTNGGSTSADGNRVATKEDVKAIWDWLATHTHSVTTAVTGTDSMGGPIMDTGTAVSLVPTQAATASSNSTTKASEEASGGSIRIGSV